MSTNAVTIYKPGEIAASEFGDRIGLIKSVICPNATDAELDLFASYCRQTGLDPFVRQIYGVKRDRWDSRTRTMVPGNLVIQIGIDGARTLAERTGMYAGQLGPLWYDEDTGQWTDVWLKKTPPAAAKVGVLRKDFDAALYAVARFDAYAQRVKSGEHAGELINLWKTMPDVMIAKCAESLALRRAFPQQMSGIYTTEEMQQADAPQAPEIQQARMVSHETGAEVRARTANNQPEHDIPSKQTRAQQAMDAQRTNSPRRNNLARERVIQTPETRAHTAAAQAEIAPTINQQRGNLKPMDLDAPVRAHVTPHHADPEALHRTANGEIHRVSPDGEILQPEPEEVEPDAGVEEVPMIEADTLRKLWTIFKTNSWTDDQAHDLIHKMAPEAIDPATKLPSSRYLTQAEALKVIRHIAVGDQSETT